MDRNVRALIIALLCVLAVSLAAATVVNPQAPPGGGSGAGAPPADTPGDNGGGGDDENDQQSNSSGGSIEFAGACIPFLTSPVFFGAALLVVGGLGWYLKRRDGAVFAFGVLFPLVLFATPLWLVLTDCGTASFEPGGTSALPNISSDSSSVAGGGGGGGATETLLSPPALLALLVVAALVLAVLVYRASGDDAVEEVDEPEPVQTGPEDEDALAAVGAAAGDAADRIDDADDVENEVYRAWRDMTDHIDVGDPETSTPGDFAAAASDAGMADAHVDTLTDLFRDVRYGGQDATEDRERRAVDALRAIEDRYAEGDDE
ncbi:DUF4129 domain-containing protein [Halobacterium litoreum]|uniref:DUF4129 domain-containing protein n=1 Tax=Halobacterium litoreum TaxID=2039234 RepID=A0ABD5NGH5_9EURY|nr:DUF4129 domain-containing protein [Halobacterium litoreum]UHH12818.1 DUF4129 domain-containing protein [Halobacterium litoreum]